MTSFSETRLELGLTYGANYGPRFSTAINAQANGVEIAEAEWEDPLIQINLPDKAYTRSETEYLLDFHATMKGSLTGFRIRDWSDYFVEGQAIGTGNGTIQEWQLIKTYTVGSYSVRRAIAKPVAGSLVVYVNGVETADGWSVDTTTGKFTTELTGAITVDFEFDVPVRFVEDKLDFRFDAVAANNALFTQQPITLTEIRVTPWAYPSLDPFPVSLAHQIDLGYDLGTTGGPEFDTFIAETAGEWESRVARRDNPLGVWNLGDRTLTRSQVNYLIALFRVARGRAIPFSYLDQQDETVKLVRFTEDRLGVSFLAHRHSDKQAIFSLAAIGIRQIQNKSKIFEVTESSSFNFNLGNPPDGDYPRTVIAPEILNQYSMFEIRAYLISATVDNGFQSLQIPSATVMGVGNVDSQIPSGGMLFGYGLSIDVLIFQRVLGPCYFSGTVRWEVWG